MLLPNLADLLKDNRDSSWVTHYASPMCRILSVTLRQLVDRKPHTSYFVVCLKDVVSLKHTQSLRYQSSDRGGAQSLSSLVTATDSVLTMSCRQLTLRRSRWISA